MLGERKMVRDLTPEQKTEIIERLADLEHKQWGHWTKYFLEFDNEENRERWKCQVDIIYEDLSEEEKESDRKWARKVLELIKGLNMEILSK